MSETPNKIPTEDLKGYVRRTASGVEVVIPPDCRGGKVDIKIEGGYEAGEFVFRRFNLGERTRDVWWSWDGEECDAEEVLDAIRALKFGKPAGFQRMVDQALGKLQTPAAERRE